MLNSLCKTILAVRHFSLSFLNLQEKKRNISFSSSKSFGIKRTRKYLSECRGKCGPYMKTLFFFECPWMSMKDYIGCSANVFPGLFLTMSEIIFFIAHVEGCSLLFGFRYVLFKSFPLKEHL